MNKCYEFSSFIMHAIEKKHLNELLMNIWTVICISILDYRILLYDAVTTEHVDERTFNVQ